MSLTDKPLPMNQLCVAMVQDLGKMYENNAAHEKSDLNTVWESMYSKGLHRKVSSKCYYTPEEIEEARKKDAEQKRLKEKEQNKANQDLEHQESPKEETEAETSHRDSTEEEDTPFDAPRNFASVHFDRALNSGRAHMHDDGRRYRKRTFSGSLPGDGQEH